MKKITITPRTIEGGFKIEPEGEWTPYELAGVLYSSLGMVLAKIIPPPKVRKVTTMPKGDNGGRK